MGLKRGKITEMGLLARTRIITTRFITVAAVFLISETATVAREPALPSKNCRTDWLIVFKIVVEPRDLKLFRCKGINIRDFDNRNVRIESGCCGETTQRSTQRILSRLNW